MALNAWALTTVARFKTFAGITVATDDTLIERLINIVSDYIEKFCDRRFLQTAYTDEYYDGNGSNQMLLKQYLVSSAASFVLEERDTDTNEANWSSVDTKLYHIDYTAGIIELIAHTFREAPRKYRVDYTAGYAFDNSTPGATLESLGIGDLEYACWKIVNNLYKDAGDTDGIKSESIGNYSVSYGDYMMLSPEVKLILLKYKRPHLM